MEGTTDRAVQVLLVEDNPGDIRWTLEILKDVDTRTTLTVAKDGVDAMEILWGWRPDQGRQPDVVLLDLQLPRKDGLELLAEMAADEYLSQIPVVILATSESDRDVERSFALGAVSYLAKPVDADRLGLSLR